MNIEIGSQVETRVESGGMVVVEVTEVTDDGYVGDRVYTPGDVVFTDDDVVDVFRY